MQASSKNLNLFNFSEKFDNPQQEVILENLLSNQDQMFGNFPVGAANPPWILQNQPNRDEMIFGMGETGFQNV